MAACKMAKHEVVTSDPTKIKCKISTDSCDVV